MNTRFVHKIDVIDELLTYSVQPESFSPCVAISADGSGIRKVASNMSIRGISDYGCCSRVKSSLFSGR